MHINRAHVEVQPSHQERKGDIGAPIKLDAEAQARIEKHRFATLLKIRLYLGLQLSPLVLIHGFYIEHSQPITGSIHFTRLTGMLCWKPYCAMFDY
jgi:hypothetical protein